MSNHLFLQLSMWNNHASLSNLIYSTCLSFLCLSVAMLKSFSAYTFILYIHIYVSVFLAKGIARIYIYYSTISLSIQYGDKISITHVKGMLMFYGIQIKVVACQETLGLAITFNASQCLNVIYVVVE